MADFSNFVCLVTGATRGVGKGIALGLAGLGATIYITGRTLKPGEGEVSGSLEETAAEITAKGGKPVAVQCDHSKEEDVLKLFEQIKQEQNGRLDLLVNSVYAAVPFLLKHSRESYYAITDYTPGAVWDIINNVGLRNHYICSTLATRMMIAHQKETEESTRPCLIINISTPGSRRHILTTAYGVGKTAVERMTTDMHFELQKNNQNICVMTLWPGFVRTERLEAALKEGEKPGQQKPLFTTTDPDLLESPELTGMAIATLMKEPPSKLLSRSGTTLFVSDIAREYQLRQPDGRVPPDYRSLKTVLKMGGYSILHRLVPAFIHLSQDQLIKMMSLKDS